MATGSHSRATARGSPNPHHGTLPRSLRRSFGIAGESVGMASTETSPTYARTTPVGGWGCDLNESLARNRAGVIRHTFQKRFYPYLTRRVRDADVMFLNWGFETDPPMSIPLDPQDEPNRFPIQLYHATATQTDLSGKRVLEVGCGHGGGASYLTRTLKPESYVGLDLNAKGIEFCRKHHRIPGLTFVDGDAEQLPFVDGSFDAVINIESSHCYPHFDRFLAEVARVLVPGGDFLYADIRVPKEVADWGPALAASPLTLISERDINREVERGIERNVQLWERTAHLFPRSLRWLSRGVVPVGGSSIQWNIHRDRLVYRMYHFKNGAAG